MISGCTTHTRCAPTGSRGSRCSSCSCPSSCSCCSSSSSSPARPPQPRARPRSRPPSPSWSPGPPWPAAAAANARAGRDGAGCPGVVQPRPGRDCRSARRTAARKAHMSRPATRRGGASDGPASRGLPLARPRHVRVCAGGAGPGSRGRFVRVRGGSARSRFRVACGCSAAALAPGTRVSAQAGPQARIQSPAPTGNPASPRGCRVPAGVQVSRAGVLTGRDARADRRPHSLHGGRRAARGPRSPPRSARGPG